MVMTYPEVRRHKEFNNIRTFIKEYRGKEGRSSHYNVASKNACIFLERLMVDFSYLLWFPWPEISIKGINTVMFLFYGKNIGLSMEVLANETVELFYRTDKIEVYDEMHIDDIFPRDFKKYIEKSAGALYYSRTGIEVSI